MAVQYTNLGRNRNTENVNRAAARKAIAAVKRGQGFVAYAKENNFNVNELSQAVKALGFTMKRGRKASA
jgi:hypothetical protein